MLLKFTCDNIFGKTKMTQNETIIKSSLFQNFNTFVLYEIRLPWSIVSTSFMVASTKMRIDKLLYRCTLLILNYTQMLMNFLLQQCKRFMKDKQNNHVRILHHSNNFLVVHKPYDMYINTNNPERKLTLQSEIKKMLPDLANPKLCHEFYFVHRLDYVTSGVICIALNKHAARAASNSFESRKAKKFYLALVHGHIQKPYIIIDKAIGTDVREKNGNHKMCTSDDIFCEKPRKSSTVLLVLELGFRNSQPVTKVLLSPGTGRRHQLRVHCSYIGHTVVGDYTYSGGKDTEPHRTFLHSFRLILNNDIEKLDATSADPFDASDPKNQWAPTNIIRVLDENIFSDIYKLMQ